MPQMKHSEEDQATPQQVMPSQPGLTFSAGGLPLAIQAQPPAECRKAHISKAEGHSIVSCRCSTTCEPPTSSDAKPVSSSIHGLAHLQSMPIVVRDRLNM